MIVPTAAPRRPHTSLLALAAALAGGALPSHAQEAGPSPSEEPLLLGRVVLSANRRATLIEDVPRAVLSFDREAIEDATEKTTNLSEALPEIVPGFGTPVFQNSTRTLTLRGREPLLLIDGVPVGSDAGDFGVQLQNFDPLIVEEIEVLYGPTALYGSGAAGGVIQFFTLQPSPEPFEGTVRLGFDGFLTDGNALDGDGLTLRGTLQGSGTVGRLGYVGSLSYTRRGGFFEPGGERIGPSRLDDFDDLEGFGKLVWDIDGAQRVEGFVSHARSEARETDFQSSAVGVGPDDTAVAFFAPIDYAAQPEQETTIASVTYVHDDLAGGTLRLQAHRRDEELVQVGTDIRGRGLPDFLPVLFQTNGEAEATGLRADYGFELGDRVSVTVGADYLREEERVPTLISDPAVFDATGVFDASGVAQQFAPLDVESHGVFVQQQVELTERLTLTGGLRHDEFSFEAAAFEPTFGFPPGERPGGSGENSGTSVNLGAIYEIAPEATVFASFAQGFSLPDLTRASAAVPPGEAVEGSGLFEPVVVDSYELGLRGARGALEYALAAFFAESDRGSAVSVDPATGIAELTRAPQRNWGFEASAEAQLTGRLRLGGSVSWNEGQNDEDGDGDFLPLSSVEILPLKLVLGADYDLGDRLALNADLLYVGGRDRAFEDGVDEFEVEGYATLDAGLTYDFAPGELAVQVKNVLDDEYLPFESQSRFGATADRRFGGLGRQLAVTYTRGF